MLIPLKKKGVITVVGGHHVTLLKEKILEDFAEIDFAFYGDVMSSFYNFCCNIANKNINFSSINNLIYRKEGKIVVNAENNEIIPNGINLNRNIIKVTPEFIPKQYKNAHVIITSRGCYFNCNYCINSVSSHIYYRSINDILAEINDLYVIYGRDLHIVFQDCNFLLKKDRALKILEALKKINVTFNFHARADQIIAMQEIIPYMKKCGCKAINIGVENINDAVLKRFNKGISSAENLRAIEILNSASISPVIYYIMFDPFMTVNDLLNSIRFIKKYSSLHFYMSNNLFNILEPFYGTEYFKKFGKFYDSIFHRLHNVEEIKFIDLKVKFFVNLCYEFRNMYDDIFLKIWRKIDNKSVKKEEDYLVIWALNNIYFDFFEVSLNFIESGELVNLSQVIENKLIKAYFIILKDYMRINDYECVIN